VSRMSELDAELQRLSDLDMAVRNYLSHLYAFEQGSEHDGAHADYWREQMDCLTSGEMFQTFGGDKFDKYGDPVEVS
jgi:hypothetical protein